MKMMKQVRSTVIMLLLICLCLTGCGQGHKLQKQALETYAAEHDCVWVGSPYEYRDIDNVYVMRGTDIHLEYWDMRTRSDTKVWFNEKADTVLTDDAVYTEDNGPGSLKHISGTNDDISFHLIMSGDTAIYMEGNEDIMNDVIAVLGI